jgi:hypothetical protein
LIEVNLMLLTTLAPVLLAKCGARNYLMECASPAEKIFSINMEDNK